MVILLVANPYFWTQQTNQSQELLAQRQKCIQSLRHVLDVRNAICPSSSKFNCSVVIRVIDMVNTITGAYTIYW